MKKLRLLFNKHDYSSVGVECLKNMADTFFVDGFTYFDTTNSNYKNKGKVASCEMAVKRYSRLSYTIINKLSLFMMNSVKNYGEQLLCS